MERACFGWFQGGKHWCQPVSAGFGSFHFLVITFARACAEGIEELHGVKTRVQGILMVK